MFGVVVVIWRYLEKRLYVSWVLRKSRRFFGIRLDNEVFFKLSYGVKVGKCENVLFVWGVLSS